MENTRVHIVVSGKVQGVAFRYYTIKEARGLGLSGWVRNLPDGSVEIEAEGPPGDLARLEAWCHTGSPMARVAGVEAQAMEPTWSEEGFHRRPTPRR